LESNFCVYPLGVYLKSDGNIQLWAGLFFAASAQKKEVLLWLGWVVWREAKPPNAWFWGSLCNSKRWAIFASGRLQKRPSHRVLILEPA
jgi:hypothetical protein